MKKLLSIITIMAVAICCHAAKTYHYGLEIPLGQSPASLEAALQKKGFKKNASVSRSNSLVYDGTVNNNKVTIIIEGDDDGVQLVTEMANFDGDAVSKEMGKREAFLKSTYPDNVPTMKDVADNIYSIEPESSWYMRLLPRKLVYIASVGQTVGYFTGYEQGIVNVAKTLKSQAQQAMLQQYESKSAEELFKEAIDLGVDRHDYAGKIELLKICAAKGYPRAEMEIGLTYGVRFEDYSKAEHWYKIAAEHGQKECYSLIAHLYRFGRGRPVDYAEAVKWYQRGVDAGDAECMWDLGNLYIEGDRVSQDIKKGMSLINQAAYKGHETAKEMYPKFVEIYKRYGIGWE